MTLVLCIRLVNLSHYSSLKNHDHNHIVSHFWALETKNKTGTRTRSITADQHDQSEQIKPANQRRPTHPNNTVNQSKSARPITADQFGQLEQIRTTNQHRSARPMRADQQPIKADQYQDQSHQTRESEQTISKKIRADQPIRAEQHG